MEEKMDNNYNLRITWIDQLKGFTMLAVVIAHACGSLFYSDMFDNYYTRTINQILDMWIMPLFFCTSGYVFSVAYVTWGKEVILKKEKIKRQIKNLIFLYVVFSVLQIIAKMIFADEVNSQVSIIDIFLIPIKAIQQYWYIYTLILLYIIFYFVLSKIPPHKLKKVMFCTFCISLAYAIVNLDKFVVGITLIKVLYNGFFFFLGVFYKNYSVKLFDSKICVFTQFVYIIIVLCYKICGGNIIFLVRFFTALSVTSCLFFFFRYCFKKNNILGNILCLIGKYSLEIYVFHEYFTSGGRVALKLFNIENWVIACFFLVIIGLLCPIVISLFMKRMKLWKYFFAPFKSNQYKLSKE